jgi:phosphoglycolate phosphatase
MADAAPTALIFDWDNTLVDSWNTIHLALEKTFQSFGLTPWKLEETRERVRKSLRDSFPELFGDEWPKARDLYLETFRSIHLEHLCPLPGAVELLEWAGLTARLPLAIVSNKTGSILRTELDHLNWSAHFVAAVGAGDAIYDKPNAAPVEIVRRKLNPLNNKNIWFVGDTDIDLECARNSGCIPVLITQYEDKLAEQVPNDTLVYGDLQELRKHLERVS